MVTSNRRLRIFLVAALATVFLIVAACFTVNCLVDPLWYLSGNLLTKINYPFNERLSKLNRLLPHLGDYDCVIFGTSRATMLPEDEVKDHHCFNLAFSDGQASEYLPYADYLRQRHFAPRLIIVDVRRDELAGAVPEPDVPDFVRNGAAAPSLFASYLSLDALGFSIRTLRGDAPHHRYYDAAFQTQLEVRSKKHWYKPPASIEPQPPPYDVRPERVRLYVELRRKFPEARAIAYLPPESAWRIAAFSLTPAFDAYLAAVGTIAAAYDEFLDFSYPSRLTQSKVPADTYDGSHYSRKANGPVLAGLMAGKTDLALDWHRHDAGEIAALYHRRLADFIAKQKEKATVPAEASSAR
jgi:hypothetical protein